jgi:glycogen debranching enzyme
MSSPLNAGVPVATFAGEGVVTLVEGSTFCLSAVDGDVQPGGAHGLFVRDARVLSSWSLLLDNLAAQPLSVQPGAVRARFVGRRRPLAGRADSTLLVVRDRTIDGGLSETITLTNVGAEPTTVILSLNFDADFADLFSVKEGRATNGEASATLSTYDVVLRSCRDPQRGVMVTGTHDPIISTRALTWRVVVPAHGRWIAEVAAQPVLGEEPVEPLRPAADEAGDAIRLRRSAGAPRWSDTNTAVSATGATVAAVLQRSEEDLEALRMVDPASGQVYLAAGAPWFMTLFGRDSLLTAWMALPLDVGLAAGTLRTLAALQGKVNDPMTEEEPGRILHEVRLGPDAAHALGGHEYYGTVDATPLFVMLLGEAWRWGADPVAVRGLLPAADRALAWMDRAAQPSGFVSYRRHTDRGLVNQGWKDSYDGINDADGRMAEAPIALCEVQGYTYAALRHRAALADALEGTGTGQPWRDKAEALRSAFADRFWLPDRGWYAIALDGRGRPVDSLASNVGHCLWTGIATDEHAAALITQLSSPAMATGYGLRTLSSQMGAYNPMSYHNGSVWPHDTALCVAGLMRYRHVPGAIELAHRLAAGLFDAAVAFGFRLPELFCGFDRAEFAPPVPYPTSCSPQAWASAAPLLIMRAFLGLEPDAPAGTITVQPALPDAWGELTLDSLQLGEATVKVSAQRTEATVHGLPNGWRQT